jgi:serine protease Do
MNPVRFTISQEDESVRNLSVAKSKFPFAFRIQLALAVVLFLVAVGPVWTQESSSKAPAKPAATDRQVNPSSIVASQPPQVLQQLNSELEGLVAKVSPAVVQVLVTGYGPLEDKEQSDTALIVRQHAIGSGVIVDPDGYIITNAHVVEGAQRIRVVLPEAPIHMPMQLAAAGKTQILDAKLIGVHREIDLALLKVNSKTPLPTLSLGSGRSVRQGQLVFAIGSPEGLQSTVTMGIVSSVARQPVPDKPMVYIQTDAPINPGNSGGPLVDMEGYVVGINTFIFTQAGGSEGLGFAIPARVVKFVYQNLRKYGHVHRVVIEARGQTITPSLASALGLAQDWGVIIADVLPGGPAEAAGLKVQDIVLAADDRPIDTLPVYAAIQYMHPADQPLKLDVLRGKEKKTLYIPVFEEKHSVDQLTDLAGSDASLVSQLAILAVNMNDQIRALIPDLRITSGVIVVARAADLFGPDTGLTAGDIIHFVNRTSIDSLDSLRTALKQLKAGDAVALQVERQGHLQYLSFELE